MDFFDKIDNSTIVDTLKQLTFAAGAQKAGAATVVILVVRTPRTS